MMNTNSILEGNDSMARILIVEDQKIMQKYFEFIILQDPDLKLVDTISDAREAPSAPSSLGKWLSGRE